MKLLHIGTVNGWTIRWSPSVEVYIYEKDFVEGGKRSRMFDPDPHPDNAGFYTRPDHVSPEDYEQIRILCLAHHNLIS